MARLIQSFGGVGLANDADTITTVKYNERGNWLAAADKGGRIVLFRHGKNNNYGDARTFIPHFQFQAFEVEFDFLKSLEINSQVNCLKFHDIPQKVALFAANDKRITYWKINEHEDHDCTSVESVENGNGLRVPRRSGGQAKTSAKVCRTYKNAHAYNINSLDTSKDKDILMSADDLRVNLWNVENPSACLSYVDFKPSNMTELSEVITCARFFPKSSNLFHISSSKGIVRVGDMRDAAICRSYSKTFQQPDDGLSTNKGAYSELTNAITDTKVSPNELYIAVRDYMSVKIWDLRMEKEPTHNITVHDNLEPHLPDLYGSEAIFDRFEVDWSPISDTRVITGSYNNKFYIYDVAKSSTVPTVEASTPDFSSNDGPRTKIDPKKRVLHHVFHPAGDTVAVAGLAGLHLYSLSI